MLKYKSGWANPSEATLAPAIPYRYTLRACCAEEGVIQWNSKSAM